MHRPPPPQHTRPGSKGGKGGKGGRGGRGGRGGSGVGFHRPTHVPQNPSFPFNGSLQSHVNLPNPPPNPFQSSTFAQASHPFLHNLVFPHTNPTSDRHSAIQRIEAVAVKARRELIAAGQSVSAWKVSQAALLALKIDAWSSLGFQIQDVPSLHNLIVTEGKINAFIHCFVGSQRITSLYELEVAICKNEGVERFEELSLGPILRQPLIEHYFSVSSNVTNIFKITTEEIICILRTFMEKHKRIVLEEFLDFVAEKKSSSREMLCVRIQSLGLHISYIRQANKEEKASLRKCLGAIKLKVSQDGKEESSQPPNILFQKRALEGRFGLLSNRVKTFASECDDSSVKHIRFDSSESDDDCNDDNCHADNHVEKDCRYMCQNQSSYNRDNGKHASSCPYPSTDNGKHASSCPYPSTAEEMVRLGLKVETSEKSYCDSDKTMKSGSKNSSGKKRRFKEENFQSSCKFLKKNATKLKGKELDDLSLTNVEIENVEIEKFITTWKEACREHSFMEVLDMMVNFYTDTGTLKQKRRKKRILLSYPAIGLMNIAIMTIKHGVVDSLYDTFQAFGESEFSNPRSAFSVEMIDVGPVSKENTASNAVESTGAKRISIAIDDIIKKITDYLDVENFVNRERILHSGKILWLLKKLQDCEGWLLPQFSVKKFSSLGYGNFLEFLERYGSSLPHELQQIFIEGLLDPSSKYVALSEQQLSVLLSLADYNWSEGFKTKNDALMLLKKQFPTISFNIIGDDLEKCFLNLIKCQKDNDGQGCVLFSAALLGKQWTRMDHYGKYSSQTAVLTNPQICSSATSTFENAIDCLLAAPMLSDLFSWSHWDIVYAPSFGPLIDWLLNEVPTKELLCIATKDGKLIKVDSSTTVDEFLRALIQLSPFHAALKLLSLVSLYRGTSHAPVALLKSYAEQAMSVIIRNFLDSGELKMARKNSTGSPQELAVSDEEHNLDPCSIDLLGISLFRHENGLGKSFSKVNKASSVVARLILDCLSLLPSEFWTFVADILVSSLRSFTREAPSIILSECNKPEERLMLHNIGISLGLEEWVQDYHVFSSTVLMNRKKSQSIPYSLCSESGRDGKHIDLSVELKNVALTNDTPSNKQDKSFSEVKQKEFKLHHGCHKGFDSNPDKEIINGALHENSSMPDSKKIQDSNVVIEAIRREEFGLDQNYSDNESCLLTKQHARLGRALHCLSQELYSQDSHLLLELVQNADDNVYDHTVEPTLVFILQEAGIIVLNNEVGFSADNIRALCDIGNSTKKGSSAGYIGHKGIGFKSVFRVTDAPEIHSNGFHVKFDITEDQIGFVLPTVISPCDMDMFKQLLSGEDLEDNHTSWNTCIILPFRSKLVKETTMSSIISMFSDLHPSLLLFLHKLRCIRLENMLNDTSLVLRRETRDDGIVKVSHGNQMMSWLVVSKRLQANVTRQGVETTEIAVAFTLQESERGEYRPFLSQQPAFAFLPLRNYGLKFIVQGDFILPSSREEVDGDSAWNQWLLSEFPALFVNAEQSFCSLSCYQENPGKAVTAYLSFVPLVGEVHGFFSHLPHMIISKLRMSNCLLLDGPSNDWVLPCRTLRGWNEQARLTLPDCLLQKHLGLVYLNKDIIISDALAKALGVHDYGPKLLIDFVSSLCRSSDGIKSLGLDWLSSWFVVLHSSFASPSYLNSSINHRMEFELINALRNIPLIPLSDGSYGSISDGPIWLPCDVCSVGLDRQQYQNLFPILYSKLRIVNPLLFSTSRMTADNLVDKKVEYLIQTLLKIGVQQLSAHEVIKSHILAALSDDEELKNDEDSNWMIEYLAFIMVHLQFPCSSCHLEKDEIINKLRKSSILLTNQGFRCPEKEPIHFPKEYGNPVDIDKLIGTLDLQWLEVDIGYLKHPSCHSLSSVQHIWREFLKELGVTDFVLIKSVRKHAADVLLSGGTICDEELILATTFINDWESTELDRILSTLSLNKCRDKCVYLLEILDKMWDQCYSSKAISFFFSEFSEYKKPVRSSFMKNICKIGWIASSMDLELHEATDLFHDCKEVRSLLGDMAPYAVPQLNSKLLLKEIGFKTEISHDDAFSIFNCWRMSKAPFLASVNQMSKLYSFISDGVATAKVNMTKEFMSSYFIFVPFITTQMSNNVGAGTFLSPKDLFWHDPTGCFDKIKEVLQSIQRESSNSLPCKVLSSVYPNLHDFFVKVCHVHEVPPFKSYLQILLQLSSVALPSQAANAVFLRWSDDIKTGVVNFDEILDMKNNLQKLESRVLPTVLDKWVSLHPSFGLICWADDEDLKRQFVHLNEVDFLHLGEINNEEKELLSEKIAMLMRKLGVPVLSEVVFREAIFYGTGDDRDMASLINWVLPYAQRYIYKLYPDKYSNLKQFGFVKLNQLQIIVVEKLFYKFSIRGCGSASNKRFECSCLLQENILYVAHPSDSHSIFLELSRFFFDGPADLHLANFLHMITTMAESGSSVEQIEFFIVNSQKVPILSDEEPVWCLSFLMDEYAPDNVQATIPASDVDQNASRGKRKTSIFPSWPPTDWKTAPDFSYCRNYSVPSKPGLNLYSSSTTQSCSSLGAKKLEVIPDPIEVDGDWVVEEGLTSKDTLVLQESGIVEEQPHLVETFDAPNNQDNPGPDNKIELADPSVLKTLSTSLERDNIYLHIYDDHQSRTTGRIGEIITYKYLTRRFGLNMVKWVNEQTESGLPYDMIIGNHEYVEVKATRYANKNWFEISAREWQSAVELGDSFSIAHVVLSGQKKASITMWKNPLRLCHQNALRLALFMPRQTRDFSDTG